MRKAIADMAGGRAMPGPVHVLPESAKRSEVALRRAGASTIRCVETDPKNFRCFPWAAVTSRVTIPFVVVVRCEYVAFPTSGGGTVTTFVCLFGLRVPVAERGMWAA